MKIKFQYVGSGAEFLHGIPARDLTEEDWARLTEAQRAIVEVSGLYKPPLNPPQRGGGEEHKIKAKKEQEDSL